MKKILKILAYILFKLLPAIVIIIIIIFLISLPVSMLFDFKDYDDIGDYTNSIYVITETYDGKNKYYEVSKNGDKRKIDQFTCYAYTKYKFRFCHDHRIYDGGRNGEENIYNESECELFMDDKRIDLEDGIIKDIIKTVGNEFQDPLFDTFIFEVNNHYYVFVEFNTVMNFTPPYYLYYYDKETKKLKYIYHATNEIKCIKEKEKFIFEEESK